MIAEPAADTPPLMTAEERIESVWPFLKAYVAGFVRDLSRHDRAGFDLNDYLQEIWIELREKDPKYDPNKSKYITFARLIARNRMVLLRDRRQTVSGPKDARSTYLRYAAERDAGTISVAKRRTLEAIERTLGQCSIADLVGSFEAADDGDHPIQIVIVREEADDRRRTVVAAIASLPPTEARVLGAIYGLWGREPRSAAEIAADLGITRGEVDNVRWRALNRIRRAINSPFSPN